VTHQQWERLKTLFHGALHQAPEERNQWLVDHAAGDEMLIREAAALIAAHETAGRFLDVPIALESDDLSEAMRLERSGDPLGALEHDIAASLRVSDASRESTGRGRVDQLIEAIVRRVRRMFD
jgi:hypothetical protein